MKQIWNFISSMRLTATLLTIFAVAIGAATFIESDFSTQTAQAEVYSANWFSVLLIIIAINLIASMIKYSMFKVKKWNIVLFHTSFLVILIGASITRFVGYEGNMHIREGESQNKITSRETYIKAVFDKDGKKTVFKKEVLLSEIGENRFNEDVKVGSDNLNISLKQYIPNATYEYAQDKEKGKTFLELMITLGSNAKQFRLSEGEYIEADGLILNFGSNIKSTKEMVNISYKNGMLYMSHPMEFKTLDMETKKSGKVPPADADELKTRTLYQANGTSFVIRKIYPYAVKKLVSKKVKGSRNRLQDALKMAVTYKNSTKEVLLIGSPGVVGKPKEVDFGDMKLLLSYGAVIKKLPFSLKLVDFELERYPGSMSPASYASDVILIDKKEHIERPFRIYMNHILEYKNFRFFQSSYDNDEKGTLLSVNNDPGTLPTYIGYIMLAIGMFSSFFTTNGHFRRLMKRGRELAKKREALTAILLPIVFLFGANQVKAEEISPLVKEIKSFNKEHASKFAKLITQDSTGRMKPLDTLNIEIINKVHGGTIAGLGYNQIVLGMMARPAVWREIKLIKTKNAQINKILGVNKDSKYAAFSQFLEIPEEFQGYKIGKYVEEAARKAPSERNQFDKDILKVDERFNIVYMVFSGSVFRIFPKPDDVNHKWYATIEALKTFDKEDATRVRNLALNYFTSIDKALQTGDWKGADTALNQIVEYQKRYGSAVYPPEGKIEAEILYNKYNIFEKLMPYYLFMGLILLVLSFIKIIKPRFKLDFFSKTATVLLVIFFVLHTLGLITRWYISGHAPWSNGYESMIYIAWATVLAGFIFSKNSVMTLAATGVLAGLMLFVAHLNWLDPQVTNLVPVLKSYWLSIHVSMITASYGFLALGALLGFIALLLFAFRTKNSEKSINLSILELNTINEMSLMVGLVMLTVGNFLGGVWANESWGRYWGWDPKETWALVSILIYAVVVHLRFIKALYTPFMYAVISLLAFSTIAMTYFGVNYYLAGMHSYAKGDPIPVPDFVPWTYAVIFILILIAARNRKIKKA